MASNAAGHTPASHLHCSGKFCTAHSQPMIPGKQAAASSIDSCTAAGLSAYKQQSSYSNGTTSSTCSCLYSGRCVFVVSPNDAWPIRQASLTELTYCCSPLMPATSCCCFDVTATAGSRHQETACLCTWTQATQIARAAAGRQLYTWLLDMTRSTCVMWL